MSKFIHEYQGSEEYVLCEFEKVRLIKCGEVFQVTSWAVIHFPSFNNFQNNPNEVELKGLAQKKNNIIDNTYVEIRSSVCSKVLC